MNLSEKLTTIAENVPKVYEKGQNDGLMAFLNDFQQDGNRTNYQGAFGVTWTPEMFALLPHPIRPTNAYYMFWTNTSELMNIRDFVEFCEVNNKILDFSNCTTAYGGLARLHTRHMGTLDFSKCADLGLLFYSHNYMDAWNYSIQKIDNFISSEITGFKSNTFQHATYLEEINMSGVVATSINFGYCPLNKQSLESVVSVLSTTTTGLTATFKKTAVNAAFGVNVDDVSTYTEEFNEWRNGRSNWTFSYV